MAEFDPGGDDALGFAPVPEARSGGVPCAWVAFWDHGPVGTVSLIVSNMDSHPELSP
jgi:hypothetical protein